MGFISTPANENITRLDHTHINSNPLLKSLYDQVDSMLQQSSGQDVTKIFFAVLSAVDKNLSNPNSPLSMNSDANDLRRASKIELIENRIRIDLIDYRIKKSNL